MTLIHRRSPRGTSPSNLFMLVWVCAAIVITWNSQSVVSSLLLGGNLQTNVVPGNYAIETGLIKGLKLIQGCGQNSTETLAVVWFSTKEGSREYAFGLSNRSGRSLYRMLTTAYTTKRPATVTFYMPDPAFPFTDFPEPVIFSMLRGERRFCYRERERYSRIRAVRINNSQA